ncbi:hypothetical protein ASPBRDRAFT_48972 [Aspergillus brasiliensis CBS 101740]|uniref:Uncharacterized protein n=1 Tax=Aspergillus brasiliensis (strain CBS 101740 / IMI 381727 / IBT 21946) TaxID=767769 RepID=A0A1L9U3V7_ASPBC|nr:hypothetical protein ASPBRDRAFT_48972 [Aspergillus brasiliensis CBS 101740]
MVSLDDKPTPAYLGRAINFYLDRLNVARLNVQCTKEMCESLQRSQWRLRKLLDELQIRIDILEAINKEQMRLIQEITEAIGNDEGLPDCQFNQ